MQHGQHYIPLPGMRAQCRRPASHSAHPRPQLRSARRAPVAVRLWRSSVAGVVRVGMGRCFELLARGAGGEDTRGPPRCTIAIAL